ncbi:MAG: hypothetical protein WC046_07705 [Candidatus Bathyarchaeia archaeon]
MSNDQFSNDAFSSSLDNAKSYAEVWAIVQQTAEYALGKRRNSMMLFLDDLPLQLGAYYPVGTNNIVLNRALVDVVDASFTDKPTVNALVYNLLLHEYLHSLGDLSEVGVRRDVVVVAKACFGDAHIATVLAKKSPWMLLKGLPLDGLNTSKRGMEIVTDFEKKVNYVV